MNRILKILPFLLLCALVLQVMPVGAQQQMFLQRTQQSAPPPSAGLLDPDYKGSAFAAAIDVLLYGSYTATDDIPGSQTFGQQGQWSVAVLRDFDDAIKSFTPSQVADGTANTWVQALGPSDGFVRRWYDQSVTALDVSNLNHADQSDPTKMPKLFDSATGLILENGKAALDIPSGDYFTFSTDAFAGKYPDLITVSFVTSYSENGCMLLGTTTGQNLYWQFGNGDKYFVQGGVAFGRGRNIADGQTRILNLSADATYQYARYNSVQYEQSTSMPTIQTGSKDYRMYVYPSGVNWNWRGKSQCYIIYADRQDTDKAAIENALNNYYQIY